MTVGGPHRRGISGPADSIVIVIIIHSVIGSLLHTCEENI